MKILQAGTFVFQKCWITTLLDNLFMSCGVLQPERLRAVQRGLGALPSNKQDAIWVHAALLAARTQNSEFPVLSS